MVRSTEGAGKWPVKLDRPQQGVVRLGVAYHDEGASLGQVQEALLKIATNEKSRARVGGATRAGDTSQGLGWVDQWFTRSWTPPGCRVDKTAGYSYRIASSRVRIVPETPEATEKLGKARKTVEQYRLVAELDRREK